MEDNNSLITMSLMALASGTHRLHIGEEGVELVEREEPEPEVYYNQTKKPEVIGEAWVHQTPLSYPGMGNVEIFCIVDNNREVGFRVTVTLPGPGGSKKRVELYSENDLKNAVSALSP